jgi:aminoglycoside 6'-N-acetyltransferase
MISNKKVTLRRMLEEDYEIMLSWRHDVEVKKFYSNPNDVYTLEMVKKKYKLRISGKEKKIPCIIEFESYPVGYIQYYEQELEEKTKYGLPEDSIIFGLDILIGSKEYRNQGIATKAINLLKSYLQTNTKVQRIILKLSGNNHSAIRCYEKCRFNKIKEEANDIIYMEFVY